MHQLAERHCKNRRLCLTNPKDLAAVAETLDVSIEELIGMPAKRSARKRGPASKLQQQLECISALPKAQQRFVMQMLDTVLQQQGG